MGGRTASSFFEYKTTNLHNFTINTILTFATTEVQEVHHNYDLKFMQIWHSYLTSNLVFGEFLLYLGLILDFRSEKLLFSVEPGDEILFFLYRSRFRMDFIL